MNVDIIIGLASYFFGLLVGGVIGAGIMLGFVICATNKKLMLPQQPTGQQPPIEESAARINPTNKSL